MRGPGGGGRRSDHVHGADCHGQDSRRGRSSRRLVAEPVRARTPPRGSGAVRGCVRRPPALALVQAGRGGRTQGRARGPQQQNARC